MKQCLLLLLTFCASMAPLGAQEAHAIKDPKLIVKAETFADAAFTVPSTTFAPGEIIYYRLTGMIPAKAEGCIASVTLKVTATVAGIKIPYTATPALKMPLQDPENPSNSLGFTGTTEVRAGEILVPQGMPDAVFNLKAKFSISGVGKVSIGNTVTIRR